MKRASVLVNHLNPIVPSSDGVRADYVKLVSPPTKALAGKTLFITGASRGIGLAIALRAARDGANIIIAAKTTEINPKLPGTIFSSAKLIEEAGGRALPVHCDIRFEKDVQRAVQLGVEKFGGIDICINNASAISLTSIESTSVAKYDLMSMVNARGSFLVTKACIPYLKKSKGSILMLSPPLDMKAAYFGPHAPYTLAKFGMSCIALGAAAELESDQVAVNCLWPKTAIATAAVKNELGGDDMMRFCREASFVADAAYVILGQTDRTISGNFFIDEKVLQAAGMTDFSSYTSVKGALESDLLPDLFV